MTISRDRGRALFIAGALAAASIYAGCGGSSTQGSLSDGADASDASDDGSADGAGEAGSDSTMQGGEGGEAAAPEGGNEGSTDAADAADSTLPSGDGGDGGPAADAQANDATPDATDAGDAAASSDGGDGAVLDAQADGVSSDASDASDAPDASDVFEAAPACDPDASADASTCSSGSPTCCSGACTNTTLDPNNCGGCGVACGTTKFCSGVACNAAVIANLCDNPRATVVYDPYAVDNQATLGVGSALLQYCMPDGGIAQVYETDAGDGPLWRPSTGVGNTYVAMGGSFGQHGVAYLDENQISTIYLVTDGTTAWFDNRKTLAAVVTTLVSALSVHHDYFFLQVTVEPVTGTLEFMGVGVLGPGTQAAGYYAAAVVVPNYATYTDAWYAYEWTDTNNDATANAGDTFTLIAHGK